MKFGISVQNLQTGDEYGYNAQAVFETASAIKSPIGMLAVHDAVDRSLSLDDYTLTLGPEHYSNGSGVLKDSTQNLGRFLVRDTRQADGRATITLRKLLELNIVFSDCIATNALIDFLNGRDAINKAIQSRLGVEGIELITDKLNFPGVNHDEVPYQVGTATPTALMRYHAARTIHDLPFINSPHHPYMWYNALHGVVKDRWMFDEDTYPPMQNHKWYHKTGSIIDQQDGKFFAAATDGGILSTDAGLFAIGAAAVEPQHVSTDSFDLDRFGIAYAMHVVRSLGSAGVDIFQTANAA